MNMNLNKEQVQILDIISQLSIWHYLSWDAPLDSLCEGQSLATILDDNGFSPVLNPIALPSDSDDEIEDFLEEQMPTCQQLVDLFMSSNKDSLLTDTSFELDDLANQVLITRPGLPFGDGLPLSKLIQATKAYERFAEVSQAKNKVEN